MNGLLPEHEAHPAINEVRTTSPGSGGKRRAVCEFCGRMSHGVRPGGTNGRLSIWDLPAGWSAAPFPESFVHEDGSTGTQWACPRCNRRLARGESLYSRREPKL